MASGGKGAAAVKTVVSKLGEPNSQTHDEGFGLYRFNRAKLLVGSFEQRIGFVALQDKMYSPVEEGILTLLQADRLAAPSFYQVEFEGISAEGIHVLPPFPLGESFEEKLGTMAQPFWFVAGYQAEAHFIRKEGVAAFFEELMEEGFELSDFHRPCLQVAAAQRPARGPRMPPTKAKPSNKRARFAVEKKEKAPRAPIKRPPKPAPAPEPTKAEKIAALKQKAAQARAAAKQKTDQDRPTPTQTEEKPAKDLQATMTAKRRRRRNFST